MVKTHLGLPSGFSDEELEATTLTTRMEKRLVRYLCAVRRAVLRRERGIRQREDPKDPASTSSASSESSASASGSGSGSGGGAARAAARTRCVARGVGLFMATREQTAVFFVYVRTAAVADLQVEVFGPGDSHGSFGAAAKTPALPALPALQLLGSAAATAIPIAFLVSINKVEVRYTPRLAGSHHVHVRLGGAAVMGSPFHVQVAEQDTPPPPAQDEAADEDEAVDATATEKSVVRASTRASPRRQQRSPRRRRVKVVYRIVDFVTEKMLLTEDGRLERLPDAIVAHNTTPPRVFVRYPRHGGHGGVGTPSRKRVGAKKRGGRGRAKARHGAAPGSSSSDEDPPAPPATCAAVAVEHRCLRILRTCALIIQHFPAARSLHIMRTADSIASCGSYLRRPPPLRIVHPDDDDDDLDGLTEAADLAPSRADTDASVEDDVTHVEALSVGETLLDVDAESSHPGSTLSVEEVVVSATKALVFGVVPEVTRLLDMVALQHDEAVSTAHRDKAADQEVAVITSSVQDAEILDLSEAASEAPLNAADPAAGAVGQEDNAQELLDIAREPDKEVLPAEGDDLKSTPAGQLVEAEGDGPAVEAEQLEALDSVFPAPEASRALDIASDDDDNQVAHFKSWTSLTAFGEALPEAPTEQTRAVEVDLESVIAAPTLDEALRQLDVNIQRARDGQPRDGDGLRFTLEGSGQAGQDWVEDAAARIDNLLDLIQEPSPRPATAVRPESPRPPLASWMSIIKEESEEEAPAVVPSKAPDVSDDGVSSTPALVAVDVVVEVTEADILADLPPDSTADHPAAEPSGETVPPAVTETPPPPGEGALGAALTCPAMGTVVGQAPPADTPEQEQCEPAEGTKPSEVAEVPEEPLECEAAEVESEVDKEPLPCEETEVESEVDKEPLVCEATEVAKEPQVCETTEVESEVAKDVPVVSEGLKSKESEVMPEVAEVVSEVAEVVSAVADVVAEPRVPTLPMASEDTEPEVSEVLRPQPGREGEGESAAVGKKAPIAKPRRRSKVRDMVAAFEAAEKPAETQQDKPRLDAKAFDTAKPYTKAKLHTDARSHVGHEHESVITTDELKPEKPAEAVPETQAKPETRVKPETAAKPATEPDTGAEHETTAEPIAKPAEAKPKEEIKAATEILAKPETEVKTETESMVKLKPEVEVKAENKSMVTHETKVKTETVIIASPEIEVQDEPQIIAKPDNDVETEPESISKPETLVETEPDSIAKPETEAKNEPENVAKPETEVRTEPESIMKPETEVKTKTEIRASPETEVQDERKGIAKPENEVMTETESTVKPEISAPASTSPSPSPSQGPVPPEKAAVEPPPPLPLPLPRSAALVMNIEKQRVANSAAKTSAADVGVKQGDGESLCERQEIESIHKNNSAATAANDVGDVGVAEPAVTAAAGWVAPGAEGAEGATTPTLLSAALLLDSLPLLSPDSERDIERQFQSLAQDAEPARAEVEFNTLLREPPPGPAGPAESVTTAVTGAAPPAGQQGKGHSLLMPRSYPPATRFFNYLEGDSIDFGDELGPPPGPPPEPPQGPPSADHAPTLKRPEVADEPSRPPATRFFQYLEGDSLDVVHEADNGQVIAEEGEDKVDERNPSPATCFFKYLEVDSVDVVDDPGHAAVTASLEDTVAAAVVDGQDQPPATRFFKYLEVDSVDIIDEPGLHPITLSLEPTGTGAVGERSNPPAPRFFRYLEVDSVDIADESGHDPDHFVSEHSGDAHTGTATPDPDLPTVSQFIRYLEDSVNAIDDPSCPLPEYPPTKHSEADADAPEAAAPPSACRFFKYLEDSVDACDEPAAIAMLEADAKLSDQIEAPPGEVVAAAEAAEAAETAVDKESEAADRVPEYGAMGALQTRLGEGVSDDEVGHLADIAGALESTIEGIEVAELSRDQRIARKEEEESLLLLCDRLLLIAGQGGTPSGSRGHSPRPAPQLPSLLPLPTLEPDDDILIVTQSGGDMTIRMIATPTPPPTPPRLRLPSFAPEDSSPDHRPVPPARSPRRKRHSAGGSPLAASPLAEKAVVEEDVVEPVAEEEAFENVAEPPATPVSAAAATQPQDEQSPGVAPQPEPCGTQTDNSAPSSPPPTKAAGRRDSLYRSLEDISETTKLSLPADAQGVDAEDLDSLISEAGFPLSMRVTHRKLFWDKQLQQRQMEDEAAGTKASTATTSRTTLASKPRPPQHPRYGDVTATEKLSARMPPSLPPPKPPREPSAVSAELVPQRSGPPPPAAPAAPAAAVSTRRQVLRDARTRTGAVADATRRLDAEVQALPSAGIVRSGRRFFESAAQPLQQSQQVVPTRSPSPGAEVPVIEIDATHVSGGGGGGGDATLLERKERFRRARSFFEHLEDPGVAGAKALACRSAAGSETPTPTRRPLRLPVAFEALPLEVHSDTDCASSGRGRAPGAGEDRRRGGSDRVAMVAERFHVKDVFQDVLGEGRTTSSLRGTPHRKAVLAALSSMDAPAETTSPYDSVAGDGDADGGLLRKSFEDLDADAGPPSYSPPPASKHAGHALPRDYQKEFPYLSTTPIASYRPRSSGSARLHLIPRRDLLDMDL
ncbi:hypothetical protein ONE63_007880 [Megalurothrips usitatus]|uniref:Titin-like n=1 Tax=Megalurothrips usitatus TaxID=439358 RepID=A0AAV7XP18_9NEOP|nr:hypothetical protein ONE63_007880 [Megalurothrips usitatus]